MPYISVDSILNDAVMDIPEHKNYFYSMFVANPKGMVIVMKPENNKFVKRFAEIDQEHFERVDYYINEYMLPYFKNKTLSWNFFNRLICLCVIMPDIINFLRKRR